MTASVAARDAGVRFTFDRHGRPLTPTIARLRRARRERWGIRHVDLALDPGDAVALIGRSGSGKTTLLRTIAGIFEPDAGSIRVSGRVGALLAIDAGLVSVLTGRENALLLAVLAGLSRREAEEAVPRIRERSRLDGDLDLPVSSYSQGMRARLGLAVARETDPEILLLDEVHEALDHEFRQVLENEAADLLARGGIVVAAGHDHEMLRRLCTRALHLEGGRLRADGPFEDVRGDYLTGMSA